MSVTKEKILRTIELMDDDNAVLVLDWLNRNFVMTYKKAEWDDIEEVEPDEIDLEMMADIEINPDCKEFISEEELISRRKVI
jgi:hypothetical protein